MKRCSCCGRHLEQAEGDSHPACLRRLFGQPALPRVGLTLAEVSQEAQRSAGKLSISGVQPKLSMRQRGEVLEPVEAGGTYILKPQTQTFPNLPENEHVCMTAAAVAGIDVPAHTVVRLRDDSIAYVVKRFDRTASGKRIHCEDFAQILGREKYAGSIEAIGRSLRSISSFPGLDAQYLFERAVVNFFLGNGDAHLKNFSILYDETGGARLAPAYDIVSSKLVIPEEPEAALAIRGKHNRISRQDFMALAEYLGITEKPRDEIFRRIEASRAEIESLIDSCLLPPEQRARLVGIVRQRASRLFEG